MTPREHAVRIAQGLDRARENSSQAVPVDEVGLIEAGISDAMAQLERELRQMRAKVEKTDRPSVMQRLRKMIGG